MNKSVRVKQNWGLMPYANIVSAVMPASALRGPREVFGAFPGERNFNRFPGWLGKNSTHGKNKRLLREIHAHATSASSGEDAGGFKAGAAALREAYLPVLKTIITAPIRSHAMGGREKEGIEEVMVTMDAYSLTRADWESVQDICKFRGQGPLFQDPSAGVPTAVKTAFTKRCNSTSRTVQRDPDPGGEKGKRRGGGGGGGRVDDDAEEGEEGEEETTRGPRRRRSAELSAKKMAAMGFVEGGPEGEEENRGEEEVTGDDVLPRRGVGTAEDERRASVENVAQFVHHPSKCDKWHLCMRIPRTAGRRATWPARSRKSAALVAFIHKRVACRAVRALRSRTCVAPRSVRSPPCPPWRSTRVSSSRAAPRRAPRAFALLLRLRRRPRDPLGGLPPGSRRGFRSAPVTSMALKTGIVGLPNVGKSTLFNALVENSNAEAANYPFCTIEPNSGIVPVPDERLQALATISGTSKDNIVPTTVEFVDIAGLVKGAADGAGLGNKFLANIRECDAIVHVVRCFDDDDVIHVDGKVDPLSDISVINFELALADMAQIERRLERLGKGRAKSNAEKEAEQGERDALAKLDAALEEGKPARLVDLTDDEWALVKDLMLLTAKPCIYAANVNEDDLADAGASNEHVKVRAHAESEGSGVTSSRAGGVGAHQTRRGRARRVSRHPGAAEGGLKSLIRNAYAQLKLQTYFTTGEKETRAWTIKEGFTAPQAAGVIHTDFEKGFIKAETVSRRVRRVRRVRRREGKGRLAPGGEGVRRPGGRRHGLQVQQLRREYSSM